MYIRRRALWVATGLCMPVLMLASYLAWLQVSGNFAPVVEGAVYRSNQPTPERLADYQAAYGIRTVITLRGAAPDEDWYALEKQATDALGMTVFDVPLSSTRELPIWNSVNWLKPCAAPRNLSSSIADRDRTGRGSLRPSILRPSNRLDLKQPASNFPSATVTLLCSIGRKLLPWTDHGRCFGH